MRHSLDIYVFRSASFARNGDTVVCVARRDLIDELLGAGTLAQTFFGQADYVDAEQVRYVGVWGKRNASRLRRLLREQGADLTIRREPPPATLRSYSTQGRARAVAVKA